MSLPQPLETIAPTVDYSSYVSGGGTPSKWLQDARARAESLRQRMLVGPPVTFMRSFRLVRAPFPTKYAFLNATTSRTPFVHIVNRLFVIQFDTSDGLKTLLVSPTDVEANAETPFFRRLGEQVPAPLRRLGLSALAPVIATVEECLAQIGLSPADVDYITYDHLHTQDLRKWLGSDGDGNHGYFPNAKLLVMRQEWDAVAGLIPTQREWYCPHGVAGIDAARVIVLDGDTLLGGAVALMATPGHTAGNHSIVTHVADSSPAGMLYVTSENGVGPDNYAPLNSRVPGLAAYAARSGAEVVLNGNTLEGSVAQYVSMVVEKTVAGTSPLDSRFPNLLCSSEFEAFWAFPGLRPTHNVGEVMHGALFQPPPRPISR